MVKPSLFARPFAIICILLGLVAIPTTRSTTLPVRWLWLAQRLPPVARPAVRAWLDGLPAELCRLGPANATALKATPDFMYQLCPLTTSAQAAGNLSSLNMTALAVAAPTLGTAAVLLAFDGDARAAGALERRLCEFFLWPSAACGWPQTVSMGFAEALAAAGASGKKRNAAAVLNSTFAHATAFARAAAAEAATALHKAFPANPAAGNTAPAPAPEDGSIVVGATAGSRNPFAVVGDLPERALEAAVQNALRWFGYSVPVSRARAVGAVLPPALRPYAAAGLEALPGALCAAAQAAPAELASAPAAFKGELCPVANLFKPALGGVGLSSYGFIAMQVSMGINVEANAWRSSSSSDSGGGDPGITPGVPLPAPEGTKLNATAADLSAEPPVPDAAVLAHGQNGTADAAVVGDGTGEAWALPAAEAAKQAAHRRAFGTVARACGVLYAPELACNATVAAAVEDRFRWQGMGDDAWGAYAAVRAYAQPSQLDAALLRVDARRFATVGALSAILARMPEAQRAALASAVTGSAAQLAPAIRALPPVAAVATYGPLRPFICLMSPEQARERVQLDWIGGIAVITEAVTRSALRLDAPASALAAMAGGSSKARPALDAACQALKDATEEAARSRPAAALKRASDAVGAALAAWRKTRLTVAQALPPWAKGKAAVAAVPVVAAVDPGGAAA